MRPSPFALGALCLVLVGAILLVSRVAPATLVARPLPAATTIPIASARPATLPAHPWRDARARLTGLIGLAGRAGANARPAVMGPATRLSRWTAGRADAARQSVTAALGATRRRASAVTGALARFGARLQDDRRRADAALHASLRRANIGIQDRARAVFSAIRTAPWSR